MKNTWNYDQIIETGMEVIHRTCTHHYNDAYVYSTPYFRLYLKFRLDSPSGNRQLRQANIYADFKAETFYVINTLKIDLELKSIYEIRLQHLI